MTTIQKVITLLFIAIITPTLIFAQDNEWKLKKDKKGIKVYYRDSPTSDIKALKMAIRFENTSLSAIFAVLNDVDAYTDWVYKNTVSYRVEGNNSEGYYYNVSDFPWPMSDRDYVFYSTVKQDPITKVITSVATAVNEKVPEDENMVRVTDASITWIFTPNSDGSVSLDYTLSADPAGSVPAWMINMALDYGPMQTMERFRDLLQDPRYKDVKLPYIAELSH